MSGPLPASLATAVAAAEAKASSTRRFEDGGEFRVEIPSVEGPAAFEAVLAAAQEYGVQVHRVSQGSGVTLLRDVEIRRYVELGADHGIEVCLFVGPRAPWNGEGSSLTPDGGVFGWRHCTTETLKAAYDDVARACDLGIRSVLLSDEGLIEVVDQGRRSGALPADLVIKASAMLGIANAVGGAALASLGVDTLNVAGDVRLGDLAAFRALTEAAIDLYVEGPDGLGGFMRYHDLGEIVRLAAPVHLKFGLRNAPGIYPAGHHLDAAVLSSARERVRRAAIGLEHLARQRPEAEASPVGRRPGVPVR
jgi:hypothetical protein